MCGYDWKNQEARKQKARGKITHINKHIPRCRICNAIGDHSGFCRMHYEQQAELAYNKRMESYREPGKNDFEIDVLTKKVIPKKPEEENENE